ncbi:hypothetical protein DFH07DRAFT_962327 [Mycena maculata]|uniref:Uncharacterized protein n=2 Tax=Mycena maculata TaxID=230809 RepID=A0AAD7ISH7_9AGAR|nr:hypothetical protein DFH07DRAFT_962327 [Mycena maculata]
MHNLWTSYSRKMRSGTVFAAWMPEVNALQAEDFQFGPLVSRAVAAESDNQEDQESDDDMDDIDVEWPPNPDNFIDEEWPPRDPLNEIDDPPPPPPPRKRRPSPSFDDLLATGKPQTGNHRRRAAKRAKGIQHEGYKPRESTIRDHVLPAEPVASPAFDAATLPAAQGAYAAKVESKQEKYGSKKRRTLAEMIALGFQVIHWNGIDARPLVDSTGRIFAVLAGQPTKEGYPEAVIRAYDFIKTQGTASHFPAAMCRHRRGLFAAINIGLVYGKGQTAPTWLDNKQHTSLAESLLSNKDITRMANFASFAFSLWAPRLHCYYVDYNSRLSPHLRRPFPKSVFASVAFNFGSNVWTFKHRDVCNLPYGWCAVQSLGRFDATKGGHLIFWDLKMVVEFPAGALILLPSATIAHSNIPVQDGEERMSFTQFTAGGLFRYIDNGFRTQDKLAAEDPEEFARLMKLRESRWQDGLALFSTLDELLPDD